jgi:alpha-L-rhamnosidase
LLAFKSIFVNAFLSSNSLTYSYTFIQNSLRIMAKFFLALLLLPAFVVKAQSASSFKITNTKTEYLDNPIGLDNPAPRLTWQISTTKNGFHQRAYRILVATDSLSLLQAKGDFQWDSKWIVSENSLIQYSGKALSPLTKYYWRVDVKDNNDQTANHISSFETGMMQSSNWKGSWIADSENSDTKEAPYFRKSFNTSKRIKSARAYMAVAGLFELYINGTKAGDHCLDPMYTRFDRRTLYVTHDVTALLSGGTNTIGVLLGNGWYNHQSTAVWNFHKAPWRNRPAFCMDVRITYTDNTVETITTGTDWKTALSPVIFNSIYTAEHYDAGKELNGWNTNSFIDTNWKAVIPRSAPSRNITAQSMHPVRKTDTLAAQHFTKVNDSVYVFDFGRNISGVSEIRVKGSAGTILKIKHGERLTKKGRVDLSNIDVHYRPKDNTDPFQTDIFILKGSGEESFSPRFNYKGFQYAEVISSEPVELKQGSMTAYFMHSDVPVAGTIKTSNPTINKLWSATNASYLSNLFGYPTDCPQREKNGWTGDAVIANETGLYNFDGITVYEKWLADHRDEQQPNGVLPSIIPTGGWGYEWGNGPDWTSSIAVIPWNIYLFYGDKKLLADNYENIKRYVDHITDISPDGLTTWGLGDWVPVKSKAPVELTSTCYYYADVMILAKAAALFGKKQDELNYSALAKKIKTAFNEKYLDKSQNIYGTGLQTELSVPLYWGLVPDELKNKIAASLAKRVEADQWQLDVGLLGQKAILNALSENGYADIAYRLASRETYPSWGWWIKNGATTLYENWDIDAANDISLNHIMFGEIGAWLYKGLGGIYPDPKHPGFKHILFKPNFATDLDEFEATHKSLYGEIKSSWKTLGTKIIYTVVVPPNASATVFFTSVKDKKISLQGDRVVNNKAGLLSGSYSFTIEAD